MPTEEYSPARPPSGQGGTNGAGAKTEQGGGPPSPLPTISVPKSGGALRGIGEKFSVNAASGTGSLRIPIQASPTRGGFGPQLTLGYDSGAGNSPFGLGWNLSVPAITLKTDMGLPRYGSDDVFVLSGAEDLVRFLDGALEPVTRTETVGGHTFQVDRFIPRVEGLYARIERWTDQETGETYWRTISNENVTTFYGRTTESRIADPDAPLQVAAWFACESYDDKGNAVCYRYKAEDSTGVDMTQTHERNRTPVTRATMRYLKSVHYGNRVPRQPGDDLHLATDWMFSVVFDFGEHYSEDGTGSPLTVSTDDSAMPWTVRADPFSSYRTGFEVRTYRLCRRVLLFHHFPAELGTNVTLVNVTHLDFDESPVATHLVEVRFSGYVRLDNGTYRKRSLPALTLTYSKVTFDETVHELDAASLENLPTGSHRHSWVDLLSDGVAGVLAEEGNGWIYKRNLSPTTLDVSFAAAQTIALKPATTANERWQWLDVAGDGQLDLVNLGGATSGFYERASAGGWKPHKALAAVPQVPWDSGDVTLVDLTGDGRPDIMVTSDDAIRWYPSLGAAGFGASETVANVFDEERGPRVLLAQADQSIHLADLSGDGLADLVRLRNGEVCYWPNLGYGRFGTKITMDGSTWLDTLDEFDARRARFADIDGSGPADLLYVDAHGSVTLHTNQAGNRWSEPRVVVSLPGAGTDTAFEITDLRGNGTACLVWTSKLPSDESRRLRYLNLSGDTKPHLLTKIDNGIGAITQVRYASSAKFAIEDDLAGRGWATRLPFPVKVVERVQVDDIVNRCRFTTRYAYHHGYFDGPEREFRGFGLVEQWDTEELAALSSADELPPANIDPASHVPPVLTKSWFHTGAYLDGPRLEARYETEYYAEPGLDAGQRRALLRDDTEFPNGLSPDEEREAARALKGVLLRKEVYGSDGSPAESHPYFVSEHNYDVERTQSRGPNRYAVMRTHARETVDLRYDRFLTVVGGKVVADPRIHHQLVLDVDAFGNLLRSVDVVYGRRHADSELAPADQAVQARAIVTANVNTYTKSVDTSTARRAPQLCETIVYEVLNVAPTPLLSLDEVRTKLDAASDGAHDLPYEDVAGAAATPGQPFRRLIEHTRTLFRRNDLTGPLPFGDLDSRALPHETYVLAFTPSLLTQVYGSRVTNVMLGNECGYVQPDGGPNWWTVTGRSFLSPDATHTPAQELAFAQQHFFLTQRFVDPLGNESSVRYDNHDLLPLETVDAVKNRMTAGERDIDGTITSRLDYRTLQPKLVTDMNRNRTELVFDALGRLAGAAVMGKADETGDSLVGFVADLDQEALDAFAADPIATAPGLLGTATRRIVYDLKRFPEPAYTAILARERHVPDGPSRLQITLSHCDGAGRIAQQKVRVAPGPVVEGGPTADPRWVGSAWTILNNKEQAVRTHEPFFSATHEFEFARKEGVSDIVFYDPIGRVVGVLKPDHTYEKTVFGPWSQVGWNTVDTALEADPSNDPDIGDFFERLPASDYLPTWRAARAGGALGPAEQDAATKVAANANSPTRNYYDPLGRPFLVIESISGSPIRTRLELDVEGNTLVVIDPLGRAAVESDFDIQGRRLRQRSIDSGARSQLPDVTGNTIYSWTSNDARLRTEYDALRRVTGLHVSEGVGPERLVERMTYGESKGEELNHRGQVFEQFDAAGVITNEAYDFAGNLARQRRRLVQDHTPAPDWSQSPALETASFLTITQFDALKRPTRVESPDGTVTRLGYNDGGLLAHIEANVRGESATTVFLAAVQHNAKGDPIRIEYGNGVTTSYTYDPTVFTLRRLTTMRGSTTLQDLEYTRDASGNVTSRCDAAGQNVYFNNAVVAPEAYFTYDELGRLVQARGREHVGQGVQRPQYEPLDAPRVGLAHPNDGQAMRNYVENYSYDLVGNLLEVSHSAPQGSWSRRYQYGTANNRLESTSLPGDPATGSLPVRYPHDAHGNMTAMPHLARLAWDFKDRLREVDLGGGGRVHYAYDTDGNRVRKVIVSQNGTRRRERLYLGRLEVTREYAGDGATVKLERETLHVGTGSAALVQTRTKGSDQGSARLVRFQLPDALGSVALELDGAGSILSYEEYHPYGSTSYQAVQSQTETPKRYRYNGKERDHETGLAYYGARYYAPWLGRWTAADPAGIIDNPSLYVYARDNPVNVVDPAGRQGLELTHEGMYAHRVTYKNLDEYVASEASTDHIVNPDGTVTAIVWKKTAPVTIAPQKPAPKPAPAKPKPKPAEKPKEEEKELSAHELRSLALALQPGLIYPKPVRQFFGGMQFVGGVLEAGGGAFSAVVTSETVVGAAAGGLVFLHGVDNAGSGWTLMWTGEESKTWTFMAGAGYASILTDDRELQMAIGSSTETLANIGSAGYGLYSLGSLPGPRLTVPGAVLDAENIAGTGINTGPGFVARINCGFCTTAGADAVPMSSTEAATFAGLSEAGHPGLYPHEMGAMLRGRGLGSGFPDVVGATPSAAQQFMAGMPQSTKFAVYHQWVGGGAHYVNAKVGRFGLYFIDNQKTFGAFRPYFNLPPNATKVTIWTTYSPLF